MKHTKSLSPLIQENFTIAETQTKMNHWKPNGDFFAGDCMPFYKDGVFHLYYLLDVGHHNHPIYGTLGGGQYAHAWSSDLIHWVHEPLALPLDFKNGESSNCTGSMLEYQNRIYVFYALRSYLFTGEEFRIAVSDDGGVTFKKLGLPNLKTPATSYGNFRDPKAFIGEDGLVHLLISSGAIDDTGDSPVRIGEIAHYSSSDLINFKREQPLLRSLEVPECCDYFRFGDFYYYSYNIAGETFIRYSKQPFGPWDIPSQDVPASKYCVVMKTAPWKDNRRIGVGWCPTMNGNNPLFGGRTVFREIIRENDGSLGTAFVNEMIPNSNPEEMKAVELKGNNGVAVNSLGTFSDEFRMDGTISFSQGIAEFGIIINDRIRQDLPTRRMVSFDPQNNIVELDSRTRIKKVDMANGTVSFRLLRTKDIIDLEINGRRTIVSSGYNSPECVIVLYVRDGNTVFRNLKIYSW